MPKYDRAETIFAHILAGGIVIPILIWALIASSETTLDLFIMLPGMVMFGTGAVAGLGWVIREIIS